MLAHAVESGNIAETCRVFGVSTKTFHKLRTVAAKYGLEALWPKKKRSPMMPNTTPTHVIEVSLTLVVTLPTLGCRQYADRLADHGFRLSRSTVQTTL